MEVGGKVQGDVCARRLRRQRLREKKKKKSWKDRGVRGMEGEGVSKYMKMVVRETIASATLEKGGGGFFKAQLTQAQSFNNNQPSRPTKQYHQETFQKVSLRVGRVLDAQRFQNLSSYASKKASTSALLALTFRPSGLSNQLRLGSRPLLYQSSMGLLQEFFSPLLRNANGSAPKSYRIMSLTPCPLSLATCQARGMLEKLRLAFWEGGVGSACLSVCLSPYGP